MTAWTAGQLASLARHDEVRIAPLRADGIPMSPRTIWVVTSPDGAGGPGRQSGAGRVFVRSTNGPTASWFRNARRSRRGRIAIGTVEVAVSFTPVDEGELGIVDEAYRAKYGGRYRSIVEHLLSEGPRGATLEIAPLETT